ncbi:hypothetical protein MVEN_01296500 [Mycena venus]|uniref:Uncharacterized protein n=1 Tax=Mycena venus TaxID=2733690 RepID=A0A8H6Y0Z3_9AGAR|nr:hypothetical protein MVEN_01296500 [Mycena venus]
MALKQFPLDRTFLVAAWLEAVLYGCFLCVFSFGVYIQITSNKARNTHNRVMFIISIAMFLLASAHVAMNCFRLIRGYAEFVDGPGGPVGYLGQISRWDHIFKDTLYATQTILGDGAAVYRCWILCNRNYKFIVLPSMLLVASIMSACMTDALFITIPPSESIFYPRLTHWITTFLHGCGSAEHNHHWSDGVSTLADRTEDGALSSLYLFIEILLLSLYSVNYNAQYILLEAVTPTVGITFGMITIRITLRSHREWQLSQTEPGELRGGIQTIGSVPMRRIPVKITQQIQDDARSGGKNSSMDGISS